MKSIVSIIKRFTLTQQEKDFMRESLVVYMNLKPARKQAISFANIFSLRPSFSSAVPVALAVVIAAGSVTFAAGDSLPGELLYGIKVNVIEKVQSAAAVGGEAEVKLQSNLATKRLKEAEKLTIKGSFTSENKATIEAKFKEHTDKIENTLGGLSESAAVEASSEVGASLETHGAILEKLSETLDPTMKSDIELLIVEVKAVVKRVAVPSDMAEAQIIKETNKTAARKMADEKGKTALTALTEAKNFFSEKKDFFTVQTQADVETQLNNAAATIAAGKIFVEEGKFADGYRSFREAQSQAHEAIVALEVSLELNLEVTIVGVGTSTPPSVEEEATSTSPTATTTPDASENGTSTDQSLFEKVKNFGQ